MSLLDRTDWSIPAADLVTIEPEEARRVLAERETAGEPIDEYKVTRLSDQLERGLWAVNGETVTFWLNGSLRNGRHRLWACVVSGVPLRTWVIFGTEE